MWEKAVENLRPTPRALLLRSNRTKLGFSIISSALVVGRSSLLLGWRKSTLLAAAPRCIPFGRMRRRRPPLTKSEFSVFCPPAVR